MYVVAYKNRVIAGAMPWNRGIFEGSLEKQGIKIQLGRVAPDDLPMIIDDDAKIMQAEENRPKLNPLVEYYYGPLWDTTGAVAVANYEVHDTPIENARLNLKELAAGERYKKEVAGTTINIQDTVVTIDTNRGARDIFIQKYTLMSEGETVSWKFPEGWLTLSKQELGQIVAAGTAYVQSCFDWERGISDQIDAAQTKQELLAITIIEPTE